MTALWTQKQAEIATSGHGLKTANNDWQVDGISIDSRTITNGDLFIALVGDNNNGHDYIKMAADGGAVAAMVDQKHAEKLTPSPIPLLIVKDTTQGLIDLAKAARSRSKAKIIAITGSVGKTGTKEALALVFSKIGKCHATIGNLNSQIGLPLTLARMPSDTNFGVFELGMDRPLQISKLSMILRPDMAIITTVAPVHMQFFKDITAIADAKSEIFKGLVKGGIAILQREHPLFHHLHLNANDYGVEDCNIISFGAHIDADIRLEKYSMDQNNSKIKAMLNNKSFNNKIVEYDLGITGIHQIMNSLAILAVIANISYDNIDAIKTLKTIEPLQGRGKFSKIKMANDDGNDIIFSIIDESYNASPIAMQAALTTLSNYKISNGGRYIAVLGDMLELGKDSKKIHINLANDIIKNKIDILFTTGAYMAYLSATMAKKINILHANDSTDLIKPLISTIKPDDIIMIKGSLGSNMAAIVNALLRMDKPANCNGQKEKNNVI